MAENGGAEENRLLKAEEKEDRLSALPDPLIHHILSFLPSTREAIQTGILSKRWLNQWTFVSNLIFDFSDLFSDYSFKTIPLTTSTISSVVDRTLFLHQCSKIFKLHIIAGWFYECRYDPNYEDFIRSVVRKQAEELLLKFSDLAEIVLPEIFFLQPLLVKLQLSSCSILRTGELNWKSLKVLSIWNCYFADGVITGIVSGSPLLQSLEVEYCFFGVSPLAIASTSLKRLVLRDMDCRVDILCPNLLVFDGYCLGMDRQNFGWSDRVFEKFLSDSPLLELLDLENFEFSSVRIDSETMKKLVFKGRISNEIAISCPHLEELCLSGSVQKIRLINLPSSVCVSLD